MVDDYNYNRRRPRQSTYRGSYRRPGSIPGVINPAADVLAGIEEVEGTFKERREKVNLYQQMAEQERIDLQNAVNDTQTLDQTDTLGEMTNQFSEMVNDVYKANIASFDGDKTDYLRKSNNAQKVIGSFPKVMGVINELSNQFKGMNESEQAKMILRSQFMGENGAKQIDYMKFLNDPSKMNIRIQGQDIIITNNGKDLFNGTQLLNSVKAGSDLVKYADDYTKEIDNASKDAMKGIADLEIIESYKRKSSKGTKLYGTEKTNYENAINAYRRNLENSSKIDALVNESTFQRYVDSEEVYDEEKHGELTKQKIIEDLIIKEFPGGPEVITKKSTTPLSKRGVSSTRVKSEVEIDQDSYDVYEKNKWYSKQFELTPENFGVEEMVKVLNDYAGEDIYRTGSTVGGDNNEIYELVPGTASDPTPTPRLFIEELSPSKILNALNKAAGLSSKNLKEVAPMFKNMNYFIGEDGIVKYSTSSQNSKNLQPEDEEVEIEVGNSVEDAVRKAFDLYKQQINKPDLVFEDFDQNILVKDKIFQEKLKEVRKKQKTNKGKNQGIAR
jgi:hypothetical protein